ncbi:MAG: hypothetical protein KME32_20605 [Mojavia pulchra JT2-VF2]|jgi:hypothetical protein|uniref:Uncharacterized protein n=1 Tax=Mojavia pulchra JT2-VF2 TaxID=287848 RepID=A0A951Q1E5_9NOST|nr:hypothetical protein [Mojavia pulchra JT2-VF2]
MAIHKLKSGQKHQESEKGNITKDITLQIAQERLYSFLIEIVQQWSPEDVLLEFKLLFLDLTDSENLGKNTGIYNISFLKKEQDFLQTVKRCFYIIVNNWEAQRKYQDIQKLINLFDNYKNLTKLINSNISIQQNWLKNFVCSETYQGLKSVASKYQHQVQKQAAQKDWANRYTSYSLVAQAFDVNRPKEQQEVARKLSKQMKDKFKFELAMYIARSQSATSSSTRYKNPSVLGDNVINLIKLIVVKKGTFNYENIANIFIKQIENQTLRDFKVSIQKYLFSAGDSKNLVSIVKQQLADKLSTWKEEYDEEIINKNLILRFCNYLIDCLTIEHGKEPSQLFIVLLSHGNPLTLVIILLKIILICRNARSHLEVRIAHLISFYENYPENECKWFINFLEFFNITFAIYAENVEYNLIKMQEDNSMYQSELNLDAYRVFSQLKKDTPK